MPISLAGIGSNLDVDALVTQLMALERRPLNQLSTQSSATSARISAYGSLKGLMAEFQTTLKGLDASKLGAMKAAVSDATLAQASVTASAAEGAHSLEVLALAQPHRLRTAAFAATTEIVGSGSLTFEFGTWDGTSFGANGAKPAQTVTIAPGQSTLAGVRDAVNAAAIGVTASLVNDGTGQVLVFSSTASGAASSLKVSVADDDGNGTDAAGLSRLAFDPAALAGAGRNLTQAQAAADASFIFDGIAITRPTNLVTDAVEGLTLTLARALPGTPATLSVTRDTAAIETAVESFVKGYNDVRKAISTLSAYGTSSSAGGALQGESLIRSIEAKMRAVIGQPPAGLTGTVTQLADAGITLKSDGTLALDAAKLQSALAYSPDALARLFTATGRSLDSRITLAGYGAATAAGSHAVDVTQPATRGQLTGSATAGLTITSGVNDALTLDVDGTSVSVTLAAGTYADAAALAAEVQSKLNAAPALAQSGLAVEVGASGGVLSVASARYGLLSTVTGAAGNAAGGLFGAPASVAGQDVAGSLGGVAATGSGRILTGAPGTAVEGLQVRVDAAAAGSFTLSFTRGYADRLAAAIGIVLDSDGGIGSRVTGLNAAIKRIQTRGEAMQRSLDATEKRLRAQFAALDALMSRMNQTSAYLTQQLANLPGFTNND